MIKGQIGQDFSNPTPPPQTTQPDFRIKVESPQQLKDTWSKYKAVSIPNLFPDTIANEVWSYYYDQPDNWWDLIVYPDPYFNPADHDPDYYHMYRTQDNDPTLQERLNYARNINFEGGFSYTYRRKDTEYHKHLSLFQSPEFVKLLEFITGHENLVAPVENTFVSNYGPGHYNGPHSDGPNGRIAFVYHMSKNWNPAYGGVFMRMEEDYKTVNKAVTPKFNTLTMFDVSDGGAPHLVTEVVGGVNNKRISYTGWYR